MSRERSGARRPRFAHWRPALYIRRSTAKTRSMSPPLPYRSRQKLTEALPTTDGEVLRTIGDAISYMTALPKQWQLQQTWQHACKLILGRAPVFCPPH
jgi:hypothetical protein